MGHKSYFLSKVTLMLIIIRSNDLTVSRRNEDYYFYKQSFRYKN